MVLLIAGVVLIIIGMVPEYCVQGASNAAHDVVHLRWPRISYSWVLGVREYLPEGRLFGFEKNMRLVTPQQVEAGFVEVQGIQDELLRVRGKMKSRAASVRIGYPFWGAIARRLHG